MHKLYSESPGFVCIIKINVYMQLLKEKVFSINSVCLTSFSQVCHPCLLFASSPEINVISQNKKGKNVSLLNLITETIALLTQCIC